MSLLKRLGFFRTFYLLIFVYGALLQSQYPFTSLPFGIGISDSLKDSLKDQTATIIRWEGLTGIAYILLIVFTATIVLFIRSIILLAMRFRPAFKAKVEEHRQARRERIQALRDSGELPSAKRSKRSIITEWAVTVTLCIAWIVNDAVFNRPSDTSVVEGATTRVLRNASLMAVIVAIEIPFLFLFVVLAAAIKVYRARRGQIRLEGNEELMIGTPVEGQEQGQMIQVKTFHHGLEEKLIEFDEDVEKISEKIQ
ncbi:hypothetical protein D9758_015330 [Tetrapyrgos nigripes]|uniref:Uncharacterized protein n=1 Tax=Tetrapyrgos nigripes TaxID=182062 RepID=A0A8H5CDY8_9AGAR|nr:hypothetical protein D9758_015330 [Tetrapyrgos nigripes]